MTLKRKVVVSIFGETLKKVPLFGLLQAEDETFLLEVWIPLLMPIPVSVPIPIPIRII